MERFEYKVLPAPSRGEKVKGVKSTQDRFAYALTQVMNQMAADGWEYLRADTLPCEERVGFTGKTTKFQHMLVFRRAIAAHEAEQEIASSATIPEATALVAAPPPEPQPATIAPLHRLRSTADGPKIGPAPTETPTRPAPIPLFGARRNGNAADSGPEMKN